MTLTQVTKAGLHDIALDHVFTIGASGTDHYTFQGEGLNGTVNDPTLYLTRGKTYRFENGSGGHPIRIQSTSGASGTAYNTGVTNNAGSGTVIVEVQHDAPDVLYYQCTSHAAMNGILYITGALADGGVTTAKIADDAVTDAKLANSINSAIAANTAKNTNATHTGDVTGSGSLTIANGAVTTAKIADEAVTLAKLPHGDGSSDGKFLRANNGADPTFETITGTTINNNADNRVITGSGTANTLEGEANATFNGSSLGLNSSSTTEINLQTSNNTRFKIQAGSNFAQFLTQNNVPLQFKTDAGTGSGTERMRIDTSGRLGVGTSTFDDTREMIRIKNTGGDGTFLTIEAPNDSGSSEIFFADADFNRGRIAYEHSTDDMQFWVGDNERMRVDSSGNVGIGCTPNNRLEIDKPAHYVVSNSGQARNGIHIKGNSGNAGEYGGAISFGCNGDGAAAIAARQATSDNDTVGLSFFTHDSTTGSDNAVEKVRIYDGGATAFNNGIILGNGLTYSSANQLQDYEEGSWTPTTANSGGGFQNIITATYTKIGRLVNVSLYAVFNSGQPNSNQIRIGGLPFQSISAIYHFAVGRLQGFGASDIVWQVGGTSDYFTPYYNNSIPTYNQVNGYYLLLSGSYITDS